jgi:hemerythrin
MTLLQWRDDFRIGIDEVDYEHRELIDLINLADASCSDDGSRERIEASLGEIFAVISAHFALEEKVMRSHRYDGLAEHKEDHERLLDDIRDIMDGVANDGVVDRTAFASRLTDWFAVHFRTHDARLHRSLMV